MAIINPYLPVDMKKIFEFFLPSLQPIAVVAINFKAVAGPWGGASVFIRQLVEALEKCGIVVRFDLKAKVDLIFMIDPRENLQRTAFGLKEITQYKIDNPHVKIIHRINECDQRKSTDFMDDILRDGNELADYTIFISEWLRGYFSEKWFDSNKPHCVIYNGSNPAHFHPIGCAEWCESDTVPMRIVTHHWSDNPMKGFSVYKHLDDLIAEGILKGFELWIIGRWPESIEWRSAKTFPPADGVKLGHLLRQCHLYITASLWEPCGMHHVEGAQCGLPLLSHIDGGGIVEAANKYGLLFSDDLVSVLEEAKENYFPLKEKVLTNMPSGGRMNADYVRVIQSVLAQSPGLVGRG